MKLAAHQPNYLPYLGFIEKARRCDLFVIADTDQYTRGSFIDYNFIAGAAGKVRLKVPVSGKFGSRINEMRTCEEQGWRRRHLKSIECCYRKAENFEQVYERLRSAMSVKSDNLATVNTEIILTLFDMFGVKAKVIRQSELGARGSGVDLITEICMEVGADTYVSGSGAMAYQKREDFEKRGIRLEYARFSAERYQQAHGGEFIPNLSAVDYLMSHKEGQGGI